VKLGKSEALSRRAKAKCSAKAVFGTERQKQRQAKQSKSKSEVMQGATPQKRGKAAQRNSLVMYRTAKALFGSAAQKQRVVKWGESLATSRLDKQKRCLAM